MCSVEWWQQAPFLTLCELSIIRGKLTAHYQTEKILSYSSFTEDSYGSKFYLMFNQHSWMLSWGFSLWWYDILPWLYLCVLWKGWESVQKQFWSHWEPASHKGVTPDPGIRKELAIQRLWRCPFIPLSFIHDKSMWSLCSRSLTHSTASSVSGFRACVRLSNLILSDVSLPFSTWEK